MSKKEIHENYRVVVEPRRLGDLGSISVSDSIMSSGEEDRQRQYRDRCQQIAKDIKRHADDVGSAYVEFDTHFVCEHCGAPWSEAGSYNGGCCEKDIEPTTEAQPA